VNFLSKLQSAKALSLKKIVKKVLSTMFTKTKFGLDF
jgi:hypothetical protein